MRKARKPVGDAGSSNRRKPDVAKLPNAAAAPSAASAEAGMPECPGARRTDSPEAESQPGLNAARHAATQQALQRAEQLRDGLLPALMVTALNIGNGFDHAAYRQYLRQILEAAGNPADPIERMLIEQLALCHLRVAELHSRAGMAEGNEAVKILNSAASRLLGELRRLAVSLRLYQAHAPKGRAEPTSKALRIA